MYEVDIQMSKWLNIEMKGRQSNGLNNLYELELC